MKDNMIVPGNWEAFLTLTDEELLLVQRKHIYVVLLPILFISLASLLFIFFAFIFSVQFLNSFQIFVTAVFLIISVALSLVTKSIIDWYFHLYVLTNKKILEVWYTPLSSHVVSDILLDKVSCTEIDSRVNGFFNELLDVGDVVITFDRPTHQEEFTLSDIQHCDKVGRFIMQHLINKGGYNSLQTIWVRKPSRFVGALEN